MAVTRTLALLRRSAELVAILLLAAMFGVFLLQIAARYLFGSPLGWTVEICVVLYIWVVFWSAAFLLKERDHVAFGLVYDAAPPARRRILAILGTVVVGGAFAAALPAIVDYVTFMRIEKAPVSRIRFDWIYSIFVVFAAAIVVRAGLALVRLAGARWRTAVTDAPPPGWSGE
jgi:TRAP-type C4-dicarboxylate transport system permease small subunit